MPDAALEVSESRKLPGAVHKGMAKRVRATVGCRVHFHLWSKGKWIFHGVSGVGRGELEARQLPASLFQVSEL